MPAIRLLIVGRVQGVGFRPYLARLACRYGVFGEAFNGPKGVEIYLWGPKEALRNFLYALRKEAPPLTRITSISIRPWKEGVLKEFRIKESKQGSPQTRVPPDIATCKACQNEIFDPKDRRYLYPFTTCTDCGPRYTVIEDLPYDRKSTSMRFFPMCPDCLQEYNTPEARRFHAETNACAICGPRVWICDRQKTRIYVQDLWKFVITTLCKGAIWAIKGLGGFHLVCDAENEEVVKELRHRKKRPTKPFAVMVRNLEAAQRLAEISPQEAEALISPLAPIVLLQKKHPFPLAESVAPGIHLIGLMLPYTPLHHILLRNWPKLALVMTSGNLSDEPLCFENEEAFSRLSEIADFFLLHDRPIVAPVDDSVIRFSGKIQILIRRARGFVPDPLNLPKERSNLLGVGAHLKNTFAISRYKEAFLSPHLGDLESLKSLTLWRNTLKHYQRLFSIKPELVISDLHPDYLSTRLAGEIAISHKIPHLRLQHHAAHAYAALGPKAGKKVLAVVLDGAGLGQDKTIWGGEILLLDNEKFKRVAHLTPFLLPGGEAAEREPWRVALAWLKEFYENKAKKFILEFVKNISENILQGVEIQIQRRINTPLTTSAGRLFEGTAVLLGLGIRNHYEGELALRLEALATEAKEDTSEIYPVNFDPKTGFISSKDLIQSVIFDLKKGLPKELIARKFHLSLSQALVFACDILSRKFEIKEVVLSGGCFQNALLLEDTLKGLYQIGLQPIFSETVPPNDGGLSYGQIVWASLIKNF